MGEDYDLPAGMCLIRAPIHASYGMDLRLDAIRLRRMIMMATNITQRIPEAMRTSMGVTARANSEIRVIETFSSYIVYSHKSRRYVFGSKSKKAYPECYTQPDKKQPQRI